MLAAHFSAIVDPARKTLPSAKPRSRRVAVRVGRTDAASKMCVRAVCKGVLVYEQSVTLLD